MEAISREISLFNFGQPASGSEGISREVSVFNFGQSASSSDGISREVSVFNFGQAPGNAEATSRELSVFNFGQPAYGSEGLSREVSLFNFGQSFASTEAISREVSFFNYSQPSANTDAISREISVNDTTNPPGGLLEFYDTNLVVIRVGDGTQTLTTSGNSVFLDQFTTSGNLVSTISVPDTGANGVVMSGASFVEGYLTRSLDHSVLCFPVYGTSVGGSANITTSTSIPRVALTVDAAGTLNHAATASDYSGLNWRSVATDGTNNFWGAGSSGGTVYIGNQTARAVVQNSKPNDRVVEVFNGSLFMSSASSIGDGFTGIYKFSGLPTSAVGLPAPIVFTNTFTPNLGVEDFSINPAQTILYFADSRALGPKTGGIQRWDFDSSHSVWTNSYNLTNAIGGINVGNLEVDWSGPNPVIYVTTGETSQNRLVKVTDAGPASSFTTLATAGNNQIFRGVKFGPTLTPPFIATQPQSRTNLAGTTAIFKVIAGGTGPFTYQWQASGTNLIDNPRLTGSQANVLTIAGVTTNDAGNYRVVVTAPNGSVPSVTVVLTVPPLVTAPAGMIDWWPAEGDATDLAGPYNGALVGSVSFTNGELGTAFHFDGTTTRIDLGAPSVPPPWTACFWVNRQDTPTNSAALLGDVNSSLKLEQFNGTHQVGVTKFGVGDYTFGYIVPTNTWAHLAFVGTTTNTMLYVNGVLQGSLPVSISLPRSYIGADLVAGTANVDHLLGNVDEIQLFNRALDVSEINAVYTNQNSGLYVQPSPVGPAILVQPQNTQQVNGASASFTVGPSGTPPLYYQWQFNGTNLVDSGQFAGSQTSALSVFNVQTNNIGNYQVVVTNAFGSVTSSIAHLDVIDVPGFNPSLLAYEGFDYPAGSDLSSGNGGYGWANNWSTNIIGDLITTNGSLSYTDALGNTLLTAGNALDYSAAAATGTDSRTFRSLPATRGADNTTTWISFLGIRLGPTTNLTSNPYPRGANISLINGSTEKLAIGNGTGATQDTWALLPAGQTTNIVSSTSIFSNLTLIVVRIDHKPGNDDAYLFVNPILGREPQPSEAAAKSIGTFDFAFNQVRPFVGAADAANGRPYAEMQFDEIRVGTTYGSVTPYTPSGGSNAIVAYSQDFEGAVGSEWSSNTKSLTPNGGRKFLGEFGNQTVQLTLTNLPAHALARVTFDVYVIRSWDGNATNFGPDIFQVTNSDGAQLFRTTFNNSYLAMSVALSPDMVPGSFQSFPGTFANIATAPNYPPQTGAAEVNTLGYLWSSGTAPSLPQDAVYHLSRVIGHTNSTLAVDFTGSGLQVLTDESWGLDNVKVELFNPAPGGSVILNLSPLPPLLPGNPVPQPLTVYGTFLADNMTLDLTRAAGTAYLSSNTNIFTVDSVGQISAGVPGNATLAVFYHSDITYNYNALLIIPSPVALRQTVPASMTAGQIPAVIPLVADFTAASNVVVTAFHGVTRTSSDPTVATIAPDGTVTPRKAGVTTLTATYAGKTDQTLLTVALPPGFRAGALAHRYSFSEAPNTATVSDSVGGAIGQVIHEASGAPTNNFTGTGQFTLAGGAGGSATAAYVNLPNGLVSGLPSVTFEGWVTWNGPTNLPWQRIFDFGHNLATNSAGDFAEDQFNATGASYLFLTPASNAGASRFGIKETIGTETPDLNGAGFFVVSNQTHFAVVYDPPSGVARYYINGQRVATAAAIFPLKGVEDLNVWLGRSQFSADPFFNGSYNEFRIYDGALLDDDVQASYTAGPDSFTGTLDPQPNDNLSYAAPISGAIVSAIGSNVGATKETGEPNHAGVVGGGSIWWTWTAPASGSVTVSTAGSSFDTLLAVYTGTDPANLAPIAGNDDFGGPTSQVTFSAVAGVTYQIVVDGKSGASGRVVLNLQAAIPPVVSISPPSIEVAAGYNATFATVVNGTGSFTYQWQLGGIPLPGITNANDAFISAQPYQEGQYSVAVTGTSGTTVSSNAPLIIDEPYGVTTFAGSGVAGSTDGTGTGALFNGPHDVALDGAGNIYVAENTGQVIRKITTNGVVTTLAGLAGTAGSANGTGSNARFNAPRGLVVDSAGNIYVADNGNNTIRKITPAGVVTTFAGLAGYSGAADGTGNAARFNQPRDVTIDSAGNLYVADSSNNTIRKITPAGVVSTIAGAAGVIGFTDGPGTNAFFSSPGSLAVDAATNIYVADINNFIIRKLTPTATNWIVSTIAGKPGVSGARDGIGSAARFSNPSGLGIDAAGNIYVAGFNTHVIHRITPAGVVTTLAGLPSTPGNLNGVGRVARLNGLRGITSDPSGNLYIADFGNNTIRKATNSVGINIQQQPVGATESEKDTIDLTVVATGRGPFNYQWFFNGTPINGATQAVLHLDHLTLAQAGQYVVRIQTADGLEAVFSDPVSLNVRKISWQFSGTPGLPMGVSLGDVWARGANDAYVLGWKTRAFNSDIPDTYLYRWDGAKWSQIASFPGHSPERVFGTGTSELFVTLNRCTQGPAAGCGSDYGGKIYRSTDSGTNWLEQSLPLEVGHAELGIISGMSNNVQVVGAGGLILRFNGISWNTVFSDPGESVNALTVLSPTEGYYVTCWGWGSWNGSSWTFQGRQFDFCDVDATWALHDTNGLHWYAVGANNFANGVRVWQFDQNAQSFGGKTNFVFGDGDSVGLGSASGVWGSAPDDVYVIGSLASVSGGVPSGRVYHFDGNAWSQVTDFGSIPPPSGVHGTGPDNVWISLVDGRLLHLSSNVGTNDGPAIVTPPGSQTAVVNKPALFSVVAQGTPPLTYQWYFNNFAVPSGGNGPVLSFPSAQTNNAGSYRVLISNAYGSVTSAPVTLNVIVPPSLSQQPISTNVIVGDSLTLSAVATGAAQFQWRKNGANIDGATNSTYSIPSTQFTDGGSYTVLVANDAGVVTSDIAEVKVLPPSPPATGNDYFSNRFSLVLTGGPPVVVSGYNTNATKETGEPDHAERIGGKSVWFTWKAPASGVVEFDTYGSTFDTVLAVYTGGNVSNLTVVADNDDDNSNDPTLATNRFFASVVRFNAAAGTDYQIAVDGFGATSGYFVLSGQFQPTANLLPVITAQPESQVAPFGSNVTFSVTATGSNLAYQWYFEGSLLSGATNSQLLRTNIGAANVGDYSVRVSNTVTVQYIDSDIVVLEISSLPQQAVIFEDKLDRLVRGAGSSGSNLIGHNDLASSGDFVGFYSVAAGTVGYHLGNNIQGSTDLHEVNIGNLIGSASLYLSFQTTNAGTLVVDTIGSGIDNVFAVYQDGANYDTLNNGLLGFATNAAAGLTTNRVAVTNGTFGGQFLVAADGVKGKRGTIQINWSFGSPPQSAQGNQSPPVQRVNAGSGLTLQLGNAGVTNAVPPPTYRWYRDGQFLLQTTNPLLALTNLAEADSGTYFVVAANSLGTTSNVLARVLVQVPIGIPPNSAHFQNGKFQLTLTGTEGDPVSVEASTNLTQWTVVLAENLASYESTYVDTNTAKLGGRFYRVVPGLMSNSLAAPLTNLGAGVSANTNMPGVHR